MPKVSTIYNPCDDEIIDPVCDPCLDDMEHGRVRSTAAVHKNFMPTLIANPDSKAVWDAGVAAKSIYIIPETQGTFDGGSPVMVPGYGDATEKLAGYNFTLNFMDPNFKQNVPYHNSQKNSSNWHIAFRTETQTRLSGKPCSFVPKTPVGAELSSEVVIDVEVKWFEKDQPVPFDTPVGVFVCGG